MIQKLLLSTVVLMCAVSAQAQGYINTLITPPAGMSTTTMTLQATATDINERQHSFQTTITVGNADGHVYIQGLLEDYPELWFVGSANADKTQVIFEHGQYCGEDFFTNFYFSGYRRTVDNRCDFVLQRSATTGIMTTDAQMGFCAYYRGSTSYMPFIDRYTSVTITPSEPWEPAGDDKPGPTKEPVVVPEGVTFLPYTLTANSYLAGGTRVTHYASLGFDGDDVYLKDFCRASEQTHTCAKGRREGTRLIFPKGQYIVNYQGQYDMYLYGAIYYFGSKNIDLDNLTFEYEPSTDTYTGTNGILMSIGEYDGEKGQPNEFLQNVVMKGQATGIDRCVIDNETLRYGGQCCYDLQGRRVEGQTKGLLIQGGRKLLAK